jgi:hypothetical protein
MIFAAALLAGAAVVAVIADELGPLSFDLSWNTIDGGGGTSTGGTFVLAGTIGQPDASTTVLTGGTPGSEFELRGGFWFASGTPVPTCPPDIAPVPGGDGLINVQDLLAVINQWGTCPAPPAPCPADFVPPGGNGSVGVQELLGIIANWGTCP